MVEGTAAPLISIIIPSYNQAAFLEETIQSVLTQDYANREILVLDGGSTDGSVDIIRRYADKFRYWVSERDRGQSHAINKGFALASGDVLAWLNSDDTYLSGALAAVATVFAKHPDVDLVYGNYLDTDAAGAPMRTHHVFSRLTVGALLFHDYIGQPATFFRRRLLDRVGPVDESLHYHMDWDLWLRMWPAGRPRHLPRVLATSRLHFEAKTNQQDSDRYTEGTHLIQRRHMRRRFQSPWLNTLWYRAMFFANFGLRAWAVVRDNPFDYMRTLSAHFPGRRMWHLWRMRFRSPY
jgi:glycosyltransferase involved in cell wall biosynthesis